MSRYGAMGPSAGIAVVTEKHQVSHFLSRLYPCLLPGISASLMRMKLSPFTSTVSPFEQSVWTGEPSRSSKSDAPLLHRHSNPCHNWTTLFSTPSGKKQQRHTTNTSTRIGDSNPPGTS